MTSPASPPPKGFDPKAAHIASQWPSERPVVSCRFDPLGRYVFCGLEAYHLHRFQLSDGKRVSLEGGHDSWVFAITFSKDGRFAFSGGGEGRITQWETSAVTPKPLRKIQAHQGWIRALDVSLNGRLIASAGNDQRVRLWDTTDLSPIRELEGHNSHVYSVVFHPNGKTLLSGDLQGNVKEWDLASGKLLGGFDAKALHTYEGGQAVDFGGVRGLAVSPDGKLISAGGLHKASNPLGAVHEPLVLVFDAATRKQLKAQITEGITGGVIWRLCPVADGSIMGACGGSNGGSLFFWKPDAEKPWFRFALPSLARDMDLHPDGLRVVTAHHDAQVRITRLGPKTT